jgi:hypothetical protein
LTALEDELRAERATVARLTTELASRPGLPPPATESGRRAAAAPTEPHPAPAPTESLPALVDAPSVPPALDPPGPLRAAARPATQPGVEETARPSRIPAWLRAGRARRDEAAAAEHGASDRAVAENGAREESAAAGVAASVHALRSRLESLFASNGHTATQDEPEAAHEDAIPGPRRSASAARARAEATVAARRSPAELWALRILAVVLVAVLLIAFLLILTSIA